MEVSEALEFLDDFLVELSLRSKLYCHRRYLLGIPFAGSLFIGQPKQEAKSTVIHWSAIAGPGTV